MRIHPHVSWDVRFGTKTALKNKPKPRAKAKEDLILPPPDMVANNGIAVELVNPAAKRPATKQKQPKKSVRPRTEKHDLSLLEMYIRDVNKTPLLNAQEEQALARRIQAGDRAAWDEMVRANLRLVIRFARRYTGRGVELNDLIAEGNMGLMKAADRFEPKGTRFSTYAFYWIRLSLQNCVNHGKTVPLSNHMQVLVNGFYAAKKRLENEQQETVTDSAVMDELDLKPDVRANLHHALFVDRASKGIKSKPSTAVDDLGNPMDELKTLQDPQSDIAYETAETNDQNQRLMEVMDTLDPREARIIRLRFGLDGEEEHSLQDIANTLGLTRERIRQIEAKVLKKLRDRLTGQSEQVLKEPQKPMGIETMRDHVMQLLKGPEQAAMLLLCGLSGAPPKSQAVVAVELGITPEQVDQLEQSAWKQLSKLGRVDN